MVQSSAEACSDLVVVQALSDHFHCQSEADAQGGYGTEYGYHLPRKRA